MVQWAKYMPYKHESLNVDPQQPLATPALGDQRQASPRGALTEKMKSSLSERHCHNIMVKTGLEGWLNA